MFFCLGSGTSDTTWAHQPSCCLLICSSVIDICITIFSSTRASKVSLVSLTCHSEQTRPLTSKTLWPPNHSSVTPYHHWGLRVSHWCVLCPQSPSLLMLTWGENCRKSVSFHACYSTHHFLFKKINPYHLYPSMVPSQTENLVSQEQISLLGCQQFLPLAHQTDRLALPTSGFCTYLKILSLHSQFLGVWSSVLEVTNGQIQNILCSW